jgi:hypothetical protein
VSHPTSPRAHRRARSHDSLYLYRASYTSLIPFHITHQHIHLSPPTPSSPPRPALPPPPPPPPRVASPQLSRPAPGSRPSSPARDAHPNSGRASLPSRPFHSPARACAPAGHAWKSGHPRDKIIPQPPPPRRRVPNRQVAVSGDDASAASLSAPACIPFIARVGARRRGEPHRRLLRPRV